MAACHPTVMSSTRRNRPISQAGSRPRRVAVSTSPIRRATRCRRKTLKTIGDTLSAKGVSWAWYAGGWNAALADGRQDPTLKRSVIYSREPGSPIFQPHHQPFNYYARFAPGTAERARHLKDGEDFLADIAKARCPPSRSTSPRAA